MTKPKARNGKEGKPSPHEVHRYEYAASWTLGFFSRVVKRVIVIITIIILLCILAITFLAR